MSYLTPRPFILEGDFEEVKQVRPFEVSLESSVDGNDDVVAVFSQDSEAGNKKSNPSIEIACEVVHSILDQVAWNDFPPTNECIELPKEEKPLRYSRQCHVPPLSVKTSNADDTKRQYTPALLSESYQAQGNQTEKKMGNVALAGLCGRTLEMVGKSSIPTRNIPLSNVKVARDETDPKDSGKSKKKAWMKRRQPKESPPRFAEIVVSSSQNTSVSKNEQRTFFRGAKEATRKNSANTWDAEEQENTTPRPHPLQMFGSEYARHLSSTPLAPKEAPVSRGKFIPRPKFHSKKDADAIRNIEDAELSALTGAITDIVITVGQDRPPKGYFRVSQSAGGETFFFHDQKTPYFLNVKKETNWDRAAQRPCVAALVLIFPQRQEFVPPGFSVVRVHSPVTKSNDAANLNIGGEQVFLCFRRSREGNPITAILPLIPSKGEGIPEGFTVVEKTPRNHVAVIHTQSSQAFLAYRQRLANLEPLRPIPLVMAVYSAPPTSRKLDCYYATGGTIVTSRVGRFHIMDRSTHTLMSPSSISNRLALIEASRQNTQIALKMDAGDTYAYSHGATRHTSAPNEILASSLLLSHGIGTLSNQSLGSNMTEFESEMSADMSGITSFSELEGPRVASPSMTAFSSPADREATIASIAMEGHVDRRLEALSFIPVVSTAVDEDLTEMAILRFRARVAVLTPILTACYTRHGGSALIAVDGLLELLRHDFFSTDVNLEKESCARITLLDIAIQVVCDVALTGAQETQMHSCVDFVQLAVKYGCGHLSTRTVGYVLRFYLFVFYFGMSTPSVGTCAWGTLNGQDNFLLEDPRNSTKPYLHGGAPQASILALKDLISYSIARLQALTNSERMLFRFKSPAKGSTSAPEFFSQFIGDIVGDLVDQSVHRVDIANYTQLALHQIQRSGGSELFWYDMIHSCGSDLFGSDEALQPETRSMFAILFAMLANSVKVASTNIRKDLDSEGIPRDVASKLVNLEMLYFFLVKWDGTNLGAIHIPKSRSFSTFLFAIRRLVPPCLLQNTAAAVEDPRVYRRVLRIISLLWTSLTYRKHMKLEIGILMDQFVIRVLKLGPQILYQEPSKNNEEITYLFAQQIELLKTLMLWFSDPRGVLELFMNFGADAEDQAFGSASSNELLSGRRWKIASNICGALCDVAEKCGEFIARQIRESNAMAASRTGEDIEVLEGMSDTTLARESAKRLRKASLAVIERIVRSVAESAAATKGRKYNALIDEWGVRPKDQLHLPRSFSDESEESDDDDGNQNERTGKDARILGYWQKEILKKNEVKAAKAIGKATEGETNNIDHVGIAFEIARDKGLRKAIDYLTICNILTASPRDIASFLRLHRSEIHPVALGQYLCEAGSDMKDSEYWNLIRFCYIRPISFIGMTVEQGLRHLLATGGFKLPGEAQQIDRILTTFAQCYWEDNAGDQINCHCKDQDTVFVLSFAIIMLNTDLHISMASSSKGKSNTRKRMSKAEFISNLKGVSAKSDSLGSTYLSTLYDSIHAHPISAGDDMEQSESTSVANKVELDLAAIARNAKNHDALLRAMSTREYRFLSIEEYSHKTSFCDDLRDATELLARLMTSQMWHQFHGLIDAAVDIAHVDLEGMTSCTSILKYALALTICLDMPLERSAFLGQLGRVRVFHAIRRGEGDFKLLEKTSPSGYKSEDWYTGIEEACTWNPNNPKMDRNRLLALKLIDELVLDMTLDSTPQDAGHQETKDAVRCLANAEYLLNDPTRKFLRTGNLWKRSNRTGRFVEYRFFLFSDVLIYAKKVPHSSTFKIHEELPLLQMKVVDWFPPNLTKESKRGLQIYHPRKNIVVLCASKEERGSWGSSIRTAIAQEVTRQVSLQTARRAAASH